jgi:hypothetical protein
MLAFFVIQTNVVLFNTKHDLELLRFGPQNLIMKSF